MKVLSLSVTEAGRAITASLPYEAAHGSAADVVRERWDDVDAFVLVLAVGAATRIIAPLLRDKATDPAVVCVDDRGEWVLPLVGGHGGGANVLARSVAELLGAKAVITTATDVRHLVALDLLPGFVARGDVAGVSRYLLDHGAVHVESDLPAWPLPAALPADESATATVVVTDLRRPPVSGEVVLHPPSLIVGIGTSTGAPPHRVRDLLDRVLDEASLAVESVGTVATIDRRKDEPALVELGLPLAAFAADELARVDVPTPSDVVATAVGTPSVAEAAALLAAGPGATLVVTKRKNEVATVAVARRARPAGSVVLVGLGPGDARHRTPAAEIAVRSADVVIGYAPYVDQAASLYRAGQEVLPLPIGAEVERATTALKHASAGRRVAVVCSGDAGIYAMASIVAELAPAHGPGVGVEVVPGVTAALAAAAVLGAPLGHDHAIISLSDLLTPWDVIEARVTAAAAGDFVTVFYNPRSRGRDWQLSAALDILRRHRPSDTPVGIVSDAGRPTQSAILTTLDDVDPTTVGMTTCVIVGSSTTMLAAGRMVTPRGYKR